MYAILMSISVSNTGFLANILPQTLEIQIGDRKVSLKAVSREFLFIFECSSKFSVSVTSNRKTICREIAFQETRMNLVFTFENLFVELSMAFSCNPWPVLDPSIISVGNYQSKKYFVEENTLESSYENVFRLQKQFPSFYKIEMDQLTVFADTSNKFTISSNPIIRKQHILERLKCLLTEDILLNEAYTYKIVVNRYNLLESAWAFFIPAFRVKSIYNIAISFFKEIGEDHGALRREFLYLLIKELLLDGRIDKSTEIYDVDPEHPCSEFAYCYSTRKEQIEIFNDIFNDHPSDSRKYFILLGAAIASAFLLYETLQFNFSLIFYENLLSQKFTIRHVQDVELQRHLESTEYIQKRFYDPRKNHYDHIKFGFDFVVDSTNKTGCLSKKIQEKFSAFDLIFIFYHFEPISTAVLRKLTMYTNCQPDTKEVVWLWEVLDEKDQHFLSKFLLFTTGSGNLPSITNGFAMAIEKIGGTNELFRSSACIKRLYLPRFSSKDELSRRLETSIMDAEGFHFI